MAGRRSETGSLKVLRLGFGAKYGVNRCKRISYRRRRNEAKRSLFMRLNSQNGVAGCVGASRRAIVISG